MILHRLLGRTYATTRVGSQKPGFIGFKRWTIAVTTATVVTTGMYFKFKDNNGQELSPDHFTPYRISFKEEIDRSHYLLELTPVAEQQVNLWAKMGCDKLWSVEIKQPEVMVVRNYTPLPLQVNQKSHSLELMEDGDHAGGKLFFYIKRYEQGEVARWLHRLPENHIVELRGPFIDYEFPHYESEIKRDRSFLKTNGSKLDMEEKFVFQPFDIAMFTAGTGVVTALQLLLTENPFRGTIDLFYSCRSYDELGPLKPFLTALESQKRIRLNVVESRYQRSMAESLKTIDKAILPPSTYLGQVPFRGKTDTIVRPVLSLVCGPEGYVAAIAGPKYEPAQGPVLGLLGKKHWTSDNVYKLS